MGDVLSGLMHLVVLLALAVGAKVRELLAVSAVGVLWFQARVVVMWRVAVEEYRRAMVAVLLFLGLVPASFAGTYDSLTSAISFVDVISGLMAVAALLVAVYVVIKGITWIIALLRRK